METAPQASIRRVRGLAQRFACCVAAASSTLAACAEPEATGASVIAARTDRLILDQIVDSGAALLAALARHESQHAAGGTITIVNDITVSCDLVVLSKAHSNLTLRGNGPSGRVKVVPEPSCPSPTRGGPSTVVVEGDHITLSDLEVHMPPGASRRAVYVANASGVTLFRVTVRDREGGTGSADPAMGVFVNNATDVVLEGVGVSDLAGTGILLRRTEGFVIVNSSVTSMRSNDAPGFNVGIQIDEVGTDSPRPSTDGMLYRNWLANLPGQGIFIDKGSHIAVRQNTLISIATGVGCGGIVDGAPRDCGGRGIYLKEGDTFWVVNNKITGVDDTGSGGGIHAGSATVSGVVIENNRVQWAGDTTQNRDLPEGTRSEFIGVTSLGRPAAHNWNGFGIRVRSEMLVQHNAVCDSARYGILVSPGADQVTLVNNEVSRSGVNNIKAVSGYSGENCTTPTSPAGPLSRIEIRDNFVTDAHYAGINVEPSPNPSAGCASLDYDVTFVNNSLHRNDADAPPTDLHYGIRLLDHVPGAFSYYAFYAGCAAGFTANCSSPYNGQNPYIGFLPPSFTRYPATQRSMAVTNTLGALRDRFVKNMLLWSSDPALSDAELQCGQMP